VSSAVAAWLVFLSSGAVLVLELSALRLLAPYLGLTLETSTAVIGVALAAIAFGTWAGGRSADAMDPAAALGPLLVAGGVSTWLVLPAVRVTGSLSASGDSGTVLMVAMLTLFVPAALLSAVTPMVVRLELRSLDRTGRVVGRLSAIGTLGALVATFGTGFVLFATIATSRILLVLGALVTTAGVVVLALTRRRRAAALAVVTAVAAGAATTLAPDPCQVETQYHCAAVVADAQRPTGRLLVLDTLRHSYVDVADARHLEFAYITAMATVIDSVHPGDGLAGVPQRVPVAAAPLDALHLGAGGLTLPRYLAQTRPGSTSTVLEIDAGVVDLVRRDIGPEPTGVEVVVRDARVGLAAQPDAAFDVVVGDAFSSIAVPWHLATVEAAAAVGRTLAPQGVYVLNVIDRPPLRLLRAEVATVDAAFAHVALLAADSTLSGSGGGNAVVVAAHQPVPVGALRAALDQRLPGWGALAGAALREFAGDAPVLTDDLAPVDTLLTTTTTRR
jgi:SAM-dependent methyltransferase